QRHRSVATALLRCPKDQIVLRDVGRHCRALQRKPRDEQIKLMQTFETGGWLTRIDRSGHVPRWLRTPGLAERFAADLEREEAARKAVTAVISAGAAARSSSQRSPREEKRRW
ncbi:hypothetical protein AB4156_43840, partial [Cupriavidus sp. 2MCAB6]|uniref:hypothetical protein n=1 Tax=Cupriavidus sp. 2MCAB6 TaxID=3232981 RepID=UPI003F91C3E3